MFQMYGFNFDKCQNVSDFALREHFDGHIYLGVDVCSWDPFDGSKYPQVLLHREHIKDDVELRADSHQLLHFGRVGNLCHRGAIDGGRAVRRRADPTQDVHEGGLSSPAVSQQSCNLSLIDVKGQTWEGEVKKQEEIRDVISVHCRNVEKYVT